MASYKKYITVGLKGIGMGAADIIPGVSGGTIAFITGIYDEFVGALNNFDKTAVKLFFTGKFKEFWKHINGNFLLSLFCGILISVFSLANLMRYLLHNFPIQTWAFFFGLIVASSIFILKDIKNWKWNDGLVLTLGIVIGVVICTLSPTTTPDELWFIFLCGALAICAMILPGISGSFILLLLGKYEFIMDTIAGLTNGNFGQSALTLAIFAIGAVLGLLSFSKFLHWLLSRYHRQTLLALAGFIIGSLVKVWPWSNPEAIAESQGIDLQMIAGSAPLAGLELHIAGAIIFAVIGFCIVTGLELIVAKSKKQ
ncbi:MAG: DUF368 domain-containing protein [Candidatus Cryptobacteroides sp.]